MAKRNDTILKLMRPMPATSRLGRAKERGSTGRATHGDVRKAAGARSKPDNEVDIVGTDGATTSLDDLSRRHGDLAQATTSEIKTRKKDMHQLSIYLEPSLYDRLRECAHVQRTKMHPIIVEGILLALAKREGQQD
ncbi:hypothetical protein GPL17_27680 [Bradyrhizobium yuanmingense]|uniref:hypothetical protein n=1 Tax=Bradyrhizobium yuanmingense TaxID=108015 RepID=UPI0012F9FCC4|nr:hypothetical protein [Bradyrhizobium yuanmingense]MVT54241.1 hypothetical protein [Bradyrhizobium yuanmingense]